MTAFLLISASGATLVSPGVNDAILDAIEAALGGESEAAFVIASPTGDAGDLGVYALAAPDADGVAIRITLPSGDDVGVRGRAVVVATDASGSPRAITSAEVQRLWPLQLTPHVRIDLGTA